MSDIASYDYEPIFDDRVAGGVIRQPPATTLADRAAPNSYIFDQDARLAVNLALATGRPLLIAGPSGGGKSSLARAVAEKTGWSYVERTITSRMQARDLLYEIDYLKRLQAAQQNELTGDERPFIVPGPLFWAFAPEKARALLGTTGRARKKPHDVKLDAPRTVLLLDEIDKADPDVPNDLLIPLGQLSFFVEEIDEAVSCPADAAPFIVLTTNGERDLPPAFLRRCVELRLPAVENTPAGRERLYGIARNHGHDLDQVLLNELADAFFLAPRPERREPNIAEFLDLLRAWDSLLKREDKKHDKKTLERLLKAIVSGVSDA